MIFDDGGKAVQTAAKSLGGDVYASVCPGQWQACGVYTKLTFYLWADDVAGQDIKEAVAHSWIAALEQKIREIRNETTKPNVIASA